MEVKFKVTLRPTSPLYASFGSEIIIEEAGGTGDLWEELANREINLIHDVEKITVMGLSAEDEAVNEAVLKLDEAGIENIYLDICGIRTYDKDSLSENVYLVAAVQHGGFVEYQVSDGIIGDRSETLDCYSFCEAQRICRNVAKHGWAKGAAM